MCLAVITVVKVTELISSININCCTGFLYFDVVPVVMVVEMLTLAVVLGLLYSNVVVVIVVAVTELTTSINISCCTGLIDLDVVVC